MKDELFKLKLHPDDLAETIKMDITQCFLGCVICSDSQICTGLAWGDTKAWISAHWSFYEVYKVSYNLEHSKLGSTHYLFLVICFSLTAVYIQVGREEK